MMTIIPGAEMIGGLVPTGRICFHGYGREEYDFEERETFIIPVEVK